MGHPDAGPPGAVTEVPGVGHGVAVEVDRPARVEGERPRRHRVVGDDRLRDDALAAQLVAAGQRSGEDLWRLPLHPNYARDMRSDIADIKNVVEGGGPGAGLGAHFIGYFVQSTPWAHLDIAGVDQRGSALPTVPSGFSGFGVRLLDWFVRDFRGVGGSAPAASSARGVP